MPKLTIRDRPRSETGAFVRAGGPYPEFVFDKNLGGGPTFAIALDAKERVCAILYEPSRDVKLGKAQKVGEIRLLAECPEARTVMFSPFYPGVDWHKACPEFLKKEAAVNVDAGFR